MKILNLAQGTPEWHRHRATHHNASDAPPMLGVSPYKTRAELVAEVASGIAPEHDAATIQVFTDGHRAEALARPLAEQIVGEELYPVTGTADADPSLSASFDGITLDESTIFEHKLLATRLREVMHEGITGAELPEDYRVQMEQQLLVSGATRALFMASDFQGDVITETRHCWYEPDAALRARIVAGWAQFEQDVAAYQPAPKSAPAAVGSAPDQLPALRVEVEGRVLATNLDAFRAHAMTVLGAINRDLKTDDDFADAEQTVKWCKGVEERLDAAKAMVLGQMETVETVIHAIDSVSEETRKVRLELDRLVKSEKEHRRVEIVQHYIEQVREHYARINRTLAAHALAVPPSITSDIAGAIKGKKTLGSITDAADAEAAKLKIEASQREQLVRENIAVLAEFNEHAHLFADAVGLCASKLPDDLRNLAKARIAEHQQREAARLEAERERIRAEERAKAAAAVSTAPPAPTPTFVEVAATGAVETARKVASKESPPITIGAINALIAPLRIDSAGLASLGFTPHAQRGAAKLYDGDKVDDMLTAMTNVLRRAAMVGAA